MESQLKRRLVKGPPPKMTGCEVGAMGFSKPIQSYELDICLSKRLEARLPGNGNPDEEMGREGIIPPEKPRWV